jgi:DNA (cytosine-5)-methyltransferase 1
VSKPRLLDLYSCQGGAARGYQQAGFHVTGVDLEGKYAHRYAGDEFHQGDAIEFLKEHGHEFDAVHASPPCQRYSISTAGTAARNNHPDLIGPTRDALVASGKPWVMENVKGSPLLNPLVLRWTMFFEPGSVLDDDGTPLTMLRERWFESSIPLTAPPDRAVPAGAQIAGAYGGARRDKVEARTVRHGGYVPAKHIQEKLLGIDWMTLYGLWQSIPPVYARHVGAQLMEVL